MCENEKCQTGKWVKYVLFYLNESLHTLKQKLSANIMILEKDPGDKKQKVKVFKC